VQSCQSDTVIDTERSVEILDNRLLGNVIYVSLVSVATRRDSEMMTGKSTIVFDSDTA
jgi:hypothetical protein